jgi:hypothetical protein
MAKDTYQIPAQSVEVTGMNDSVVIDTNPQTFLAVNGVTSVGRNLERIYGKELYKRTTVPILAVHLVRDAVWVETRTKLVLFTSYDEFKNVAVAFP